jgi:hypothetical protein
MLAAAALALAACGSSSKSSSKSKGEQTSTANTLKVTIAQSGKAVKYTVPKSAEGGLTTVEATNQTKAPQSLQLVRVVGNHPLSEVLKQFASSSNKVPEWLRAEGGVGQIAPGLKARATINLPPGKYEVTNFDQQGGPPPHAELQLSAGSAGPLPQTATTITAAETGKDKFKWEISGGLKTGSGPITFVSKGKEALHFIGAFRVTGNPSQAEILKALGNNGKPPKFVDQKSFTTTAILDGGRSQLSQFQITKPGTWVLFCPLTDRDGGKEHFKEGLLTKVEVK